MAYFQPYVDATGIHIPTYQDVLDEVKSQYLTVFGNDLYLDNDSMDYQQISILSKFIYDTYLSLQLAYSSRSPVSASGVALDTLGPLFSTYRVPANKSTVQVTITGDPGVVITSGLVSSNDGIIWELPSEVTIPAVGSITVQAESQEYGSFNEQIGTVVNIITPVYGWRSVTNNSVSVPGNVIESDASYRARMIASSFLPSTTVLEGLQSGLSQLSGVTRVKVYENDDALTDDNGIPGHSICVVIEGGLDSNIADIIYGRKTPGVSTYGDEDYTITTFYGNTNVLHWFRPVVTTCYLNIAIKALPGYNSSVEDDIKNALVTYINSLDIGTPVYVSSLWGQIVSVMQNSTTPSFSVTSVQTSTDGTTYTSNDITIPFNGVATISTSNIQITVS